MGPGCAAMLSQYVFSYSGIRPLTCSMLAISLARCPGMKISCIRVRSKCTSALSTFFSLSTRHILGRTASHSPWHLRLDSRCASCSAQYPLGCSTAAAYLDARPDQTHCDRQGCSRDPRAGSGFSFAEIVSGSEQCIGPKPAPRLLDQVERALGQASPTQLTGNVIRHSNGVMAVHDQIKRGLLPKTRLVCVDLEFQVRNLKPLEVGVCEYTSGEPVPSSTPGTHTTYSRRIHKQLELTTARTMLTDVFTK